MSVSDQGLGKILLNVAVRGLLLTPFFPLRSAPTMLDKFYPYDTSGFHSGDLPALSSLLDYVGLHGVQIVKDKIAIIALLMKSLPFCCQSRDLIGRFIDECRSVNGVGFWRVVRMVLMCSMAGLYPHCQRRAGKIFSLCPLRSSLSSFSFCRLSVLHGHLPHALPGPRDVHEGAGEGGQGQQGQAQEGAHQLHEGLHYDGLQ